MQTRLSSTRPPTSSWRRRRHDSSSPIVSKEPVKHSMYHRFLSLLWAGALCTAVFQLSAASAAQSAHLSSGDAGEIATSYGYLTEDFYKKVDQQAVLDSIRAQLLAAMRTAGV